MRHPLNWLLRCAASREDRLAILGDLEEEYRNQVRPARGWIAGQLWYLRELTLAVGHGLTDRARRTRQATSSRTTPTPPRLRRSFLLADVRYALRRWRRRPGFAATAVLTLALGIGATPAILSVVDAVLLAPPPWPDADRLVRIHTVFPEQRQDPAREATWNRGELSWPTWDALRQSPVFDSVAMWMSSAQPMTFGEDRTELVPVLRASSNLLPLLGITMQLGRNFTPDEDDEPHDRVILTHETWQSRFGGRTDVVGESVVLGNATSTIERRYEIIGVAAPGLRIADKNPEVVLTVGVSALNSRAYPAASLRLAARLAPGVSLSAASEAAESTIRAVEDREPTSARVVPMLDDELGDAAQLLWLLMGAAALLLLVACANVAGLVLGEGRSRRQEIGIRLALGGSRLRIARQLVVEHLMMAIAGTAGSLAVAFWLSRVFVSLAPGSLPRLGAVSVDPRVALFAALLGALTLLAFGVVPAVLLSRTPVAPVMSGGGQDAPGRQAGHRTVVVAQVALALVLLVGGSLLGETVYRCRLRHASARAPGLPHRPGLRAQRLGVHAVRA